MIWILAQGERDGFPMIVRISKAYSGLAPLPDYSHHVIVSVQFRNQRPNGFPSNEDGDNLKNLEVGLCGLLETGNESLCVLVVTNNGLRDFIFYTRNVDCVRHKLKENVRLFGGFAVEFAMEPDREWEIYQAFSRMLAGGVSRNESN